MSASQEKILEKATEEWLQRITNPKTRAHNEQVLAEFVAFVRESRIPWEEIFTIETLKDFQRVSKCKKAAGAIRALSFFLYDQQKIPEPILQANYQLDLPEVYEQYLDWVDHVRPPTPSGNGSQDPRQE